MKIESVLDPAFAAYGHVVEGLEEARAEILTALYEARYAEFRQIYPACKDLFARLGRA